MWSKIKFLESVLYTGLVDKMTSFSSSTLPAACPASIFFSNTCLENITSVVLGFKYNKLTSAKANDMLNAAA